MSSSRNKSAFQKMNPDCLVFLTHYYARKAKSLLKASQAVDAEVEHLYQELKENEPPAPQIEPKALPIDPRTTASWFFEFLQFLKGRFGATPQEISEWYHTNETILSYYSNADWMSVGMRYMEGNDNLCIRTPDTPQNPASKKRGEIEEPVAILKGIGKIQDMMIYKIDRDVMGRQKQEAQTSKVGHYGFVVNIISKVMQNVRPKPVEDLKTIVERFVEQNATKLNAIRAQFQAEPRELGGGLDGIAYSIGDGMVLKLFKSEYAYQSAVDAINRLHQSPVSAGTEAMIYDAGKFQPLVIVDTQGESFSYTFYYYLIEKMTPASKVINRDLMEDFLEGIQTSVQNKIDIRASKWQAYKDLKRAPRVSGAIKELARNIAPGFAEYSDQVEQQALDNGISLKSGWLLKLIEEITWKLLTDRTDLHSGNIGITQNGEFRYFDPAYDQ